MVVLPDDWVFVRLDVEEDLYEQADDAFLQAQLAKIENANGMMRKFPKENALELLASEDSAKLVMSRGQVLSLVSYFEQAAAIIDLYNYWDAKRRHLVKVRRKAMNLVEVLKDPEWTMHLTDYDYDMPPARTFKAKESLPQLEKLIRNLNATLHDFYPEEI
ncbi:MAG: hypothetical protein AAF890_03020, partial [Pseudomonadota bacterium]